jgi:hypothetical protein
LPYVYCAFKAKALAASGSSATRAELEEIYNQQDGLPRTSGVPITCARWLPTLVFALSVEIVGVNGSPECSVVIPAAFQPPANASAQRGMPLRNGLSRPEGQGVVVTHHKVMSQIEVADGSICGNQQSRNRSGLSSSVVDALLVSIGEQE